jgi:hypothetical protein
VSPSPSEPRHRRRPHHVSNQTGVYRLPSLTPAATRDRRTRGLQQVVRNDIILGRRHAQHRPPPQAGSISGDPRSDRRLGRHQTQKADVSAIVDQKKVVDLPLVARNPALAALQPGVVGIPSTSSIFVTGKTQSQWRHAVGISISGSPWGGSVLVVPNVEAVQEFQIIANNPSAEFGRNAGASVSIVTKGGSNRFSGSAFEFYRDESLRDKNVFEKRNNATKAPFDRNEFGLSIGGPIRRDSTFFFASYDGLRQKGGAASVRSRDRTAEELGPREPAGSRPPRCCRTTRRRVPHDRVPQSRRSAARRQRLEHHLTASPAPGRSPWRCGRTSATSSTGASARSSGTAATASARHATATRSITRSPTSAPPSTRISPTSTSS